jgi:hypothetical protein
VLHLGRLKASPANIRLSWKGLPGTKTIAYYENPLIKAVKSFLVQALPQGQMLKTFLL